MELLQEVPCFICSFLETEANELHLIFQVGLQIRFSDVNEPYWHFVRCRFVEIHSEKQR